MPGTLGCLLFDRLQDSSQPVNAQRLAHRPLAGQPLIRWVLRRASEAQQLQTLVVSVSPEWDTPALRAAVPADVRFHVGRFPDALSRMQALAQWYQRETGEAVEALVQLSLDCPLLDPCLLDRLVTSAREEREIDFATFCSAHGRSLLHAQLGFFAEYLRKTALERLDSYRLTLEERQRPGAYLMQHPEQFKLRLLSLPAALDREDLRLSMRHADDWEHAEQIVETLGHDRLDWQRIVALLDGQPALRERMATLNRHDAGTPARVGKSWVAKGRVAGVEH